MIHVRPLEAPEWPALVEGLAQSFNAPPSGWDLFRDRLGDDNVLVAHEGERIVGGCGLYEMGQWWQGRSVPLGGVAGVGVVPDARSRGVARALMVAAFSRMRERGIPVAGLYPATQRVYRSVGYEQAGERVRYEVPLDALTGFRTEVGVVAVEPLDVRVQAELRRRSRPTHGDLDRPPAIWARLTQPHGSRRYGWLLGEDGYVLLGHSPSEGQPWDLDVVDLHAPSAPSLRTLLALLASHRSMARVLRWYGAAHDPLLAMIPEPRWRVLEHKRWMLRLVDVPAALRARGWAPGAEGELHLRVEDELLVDNAGDWLLRVEGGNATVTRGGRGSLRLTPRALGPLYSGYYGATALRGLGLADGPDADLALADRLFAAPTPTLREMY